jgi:hypothetical protein
MSLEFNKVLGAIQKTNNAAGIKMRFVNKDVTTKKGADQRLLAGFTTAGHGKDVAVCPRVGFSRIDAVWQKTLASTWF